MKKQILSLITQTVLTLALFSAASAATTIDDFRTSTKLNTPHDITEGYISEDLFHNDAGTNIIAGAGGERSVDIFSGSTDSGGKTTTQILNGVTFGVNLNNEESTASIGFRYDAGTSFDLLSGGNTTIWMNILGASGPYKFQVNLWDDNQNSVVYKEMSGAGLAGISLNSFTGIDLHDIDIIMISLIQTSHSEGNYKIDSIYLDNVSSVPEPSTFLLLGAGFSGLALIRRRSKK